VILREEIVGASLIAGHYRYMQIECLYVAERQMQHTTERLSGILLLAALLLLAAGSIVASSQAVDDLEQRIGQAIVLVRQAESAGATSSEIGELVTRLNTALQLNEEAAKLTSPDDAERRAGLLRQADEILATVETGAAQLQSVASQRTFTNRIVTYSIGVIAALAGMIVSAYGFSFWRRYRVKRTFEMRISPK